MLNIKFIFSLVSKNIKFYFLGFFSLIGVLLETLSVAFVFPLVNIILDPNFLIKYERISKILDYIKPTDNKFLFVNFFSDNQFLIFVTIFIFVLIIIFKNIYLFLLSAFKIKFLQDLLVDLKTDFTKGMIDLPYESFTSRNHSDVATKASQISSLTTVIDNLLILIIEILIMICLVALILLVDFKSSIVVIFLFGFFTIFFSIIVKKKLVYYGNLRREHEYKQLEYIQWILSSFKEILLYRSSNKFVKKFKNEAYLSTKADSQLGIINLVPRFFLEIIVVVFILAIFIFNINEGGQFTDVNMIVSTIAVYGAASIRLVPSATKILNQLQGLRYHSPIIVSIKNEIEEFKESRGIKKNICEFNNSIKLKNISFTYKSSDKKIEDTIFQNLDFEIFKNEKIAILGPTGSGKSTLVDILLGILKFDVGEIFFDDKQTYYPYLIDKKISYVPQTPTSFDDTIQNNILFLENDKKIDFEQLEKAIKISCANSFIDRLDEGMQKMIGDKALKISGGQQQRLALARAIYHDPDILVLDEATNAVDKDTQKKIIDNILDLKNKTIILITHDEEITKNFDKIIKIKDKKIEVFTK